MRKLENPFLDIGMSELNPRQFFRGTSTTAQYPSTMTLLRQDCIYYNPGLTYALQGLTGECGELAEYVEQISGESSKSHGTGPRMIVSELGDIAWYIARVCAELEKSFCSNMSNPILVNLGREEYRNTGNPTILFEHLFDYYVDNVILKNGHTNSKRCPVNTMIVNACLIHNVHKKVLRDMNGELSLSRACGMYGFLETIMHSWMVVCIRINVNPYEILYENSEKLAGRKLRNTIGGDGDNR